MKRYLRNIYAGISGQLDESSNKYKFKVDFERNSKDDVIKFIEPYFSVSSIDDNTYWFGYSFNDGQANPRRDQFINFIKNVQLGQYDDIEDEWCEPTYTDESITEPQLRTMIIRSLKGINLNQFNIDCVVYPESNSGNLVKMIVSCIRHYAQNSKSLNYAELKKVSPEDIEFDYTAFKEDQADGDNRIPEWVDDEYVRNMLDNARNATLFSLRKLIKPVALRKYIRNFYRLDGAVTPVANSDVILIVDDFGTTGTTIREMIRSIRKVNDECEIYIFTLMGKKS